MRFAHLLGWVNTRIILTLVYLLIFTPVAVFFKLMRKDPMTRRFEGSDTYWTAREPREFRQEDYRRQF